MMKDALKNYLAETMNSNDHGEQGLREQDFYTCYKLELKQTLTKFLGAKVKNCFVLEDAVYYRFDTFLYVVPVIVVIKWMEYHENRN